MSPSPLATGIMASADKTNQQDGGLQLRSRSPSVESRGSHRHSPYNHSRKSSGASASSVLLEHTITPIGSVGNNASPIQLDSINPAFLRPGGEGVFASDVSDQGTDYSYKGLPQLDDSDESESDEEEAVPIVQKLPQRTSGSATTRTSRSRRASPDQSETASDDSDEEWREISKRKTKPRRGAAVPIEDPPQVKLVTAITASGKKSHARKVSSCASGPRSILSVYAELCTEA